MNRAPSSSRVAQVDGSEAEQMREDAGRFVPPKFCYADVENRLDGALAVHEREEVRGPCIERQEPQALQGEREPRDGEQGHDRTRFDSSMNRDFSRGYCAHVCGRNHRMILFACDRERA